MRISDWSSDVCSSDLLGIPHDGLIVAGFDRPNIRYAISPKAGTTQQIADLIRDTPGPGIVYAPTRAATEKLAEALSRTGRPTRAYQDRQSTRLNSSH